MTSSRETQFWIGQAARGKQALPPDAGVRAYVSQLKSALREIEVRKLGPEAAAQKLGPLGLRSTEDRFVLFIDAEELLARHPGNDEVRMLLAAVQQRGPAVDVVLSSPWASH
ncbi:MULTISPECIES: hypothetical protein [unclassified Streptomyces]|uniref:hypothetical protein n=1 Tax=unclassified Streptomyces TaxID=2593676 RepID=UPI00382E052E